jgi:hypothetical protein
VVVVRCGAEGGGAGVGCYFGEAGGGDGLGESVLVVLCVYWLG